MGHSLGSRSFPHTIRRTITAPSSHKLNVRATQDVDVIVCFFATRFDTPRRKVFVMPNARKSSTTDLIRFRRSVTSFSCPRWDVYPVVVCRNDSTRGFLVRIRKCLVRAFALSLFNRIKNNFPPYYNMYCIRTIVVKFYACRYNLRRQCVYFYGKCCIRVM